MFEGAKKLGVTATPWRMNGSGFYPLYDRLITSKPIKEFISEGWLSPYNFYSVKSQSLEVQTISNINEFDIEGDYKISALEKEMDTMQIRARLLDSYLRLAKGKKGIIYSISRKHSEHIREEYKQAGFKVVTIDANTPRDERRLYVQRFKNGLIDIIVNVDIFSEGFDCPDIEFIQLARPTRSLVKYLQQVGRGLRPTEGKTTCIILDNVGSCLKFGLPNEDRSWEEFFIGKSDKEQTDHKHFEESFGLGTKDIDYTEGTDELCLIDGVDNHPSYPENKTPLWNDADDDLLRVLYFEKGCSVNLLASVFKTEEGIIKEILKRKGLLTEC